MSIIFTGIFITQGVRAGEVEVPEIVAQKRALVEYAESVAETTEFKKEPYEGYLLDILAKIGAGELEKEGYKSTLEEYRRFLLDTEESQIQPMSAPSDANMSVPTVSYLSPNNTWIVGGAEHGKKANHLQFLHLHHFVLFPM